MTSTAIPEVSEIFVAESYGIEVRLWKGAEAKWWAGTLRVGTDFLHSEFEEENL